MPNTITPSVVEVRRIIRVSRQRVFDAWTTPEELKRWHAPGPMTVAFAEMDLRVGGEFRIHNDRAVRRVASRRRNVSRRRSTPTSCLYNGSGKPVLMRPSAR